MDDVQVVLARRQLNVAVRVEGASYQVAVIEDAGWEWYIQVLSALELLQPRPR
jgi:hypothetical protein